MIDLQSGRLKLVERSWKNEIVILSHLIEMTNKLSLCSLVSLVSPPGPAVHKAALSDQLISEISTYECQKQIRTTHAILPAYCTTCE